VTRTAVFVALALVPVTAWADDDDDVVVNAAPDAKSAQAASSTEERLRHLEEEHARLKGELEHARKPHFSDAFSVQGYVQGQYESHQDSEDQLQQGGAPFNREKFVLRRGRVRLDAKWDYANLQLEIDGNTTNGPQLRILHGFASVQIPALDRKSDVPIAAMTVGLFDTPFGYELIESPRTRYFMERTQASRAFFPGEPDLGIWLHGGLSFLRWSIGLMNGQPLETKPFGGLSPASAKDLVLRVGVETHPRENLEISGNVSTLRGRGFHGGSDATKNQILWRDVNEDGAIQPAELSGQPATGALPSSTFEHWAIGADVQTRWKTKVGTTAVMAEVQIGQNLDRGLYVADPVLTSLDSRELGFYAGITQEVTRWGVVGFRYDYYDPNGDFFDKRAGKLIPTNQAIHTLSPLVGLRLPADVHPFHLFGHTTGDRARLLFQYDFIRDHFARNAAGIPADLKNDTFMLRLQVSL
jgi:hypothetical protein